MKKLWEWVIVIAIVVIALQLPCGGRHGYDVIAASLEALVWRCECSFHRCPEPDSDPPVVQWPHWQLSLTSINSSSSRSRNRSRDSSSVGPCHDVPEAPSRFGPWVLCHPGGVVHVSCVSATSLSLLFGTQPRGTLHQHGRAHGRDLRKRHLFSQPKPQPYEPGDRGTLLLVGHGPGAWYGIHARARLLHQLHRWPPGPAESHGAAGMPTPPLLWSAAVFQHCVWLVVSLVSV